MRGLPEGRLAAWDDLAEWRHYDRQIPSARTVDDDRSSSRSGPFFLDPGQDEDILGAIMGQLDGDEGGLYATQAKGRLRAHFWMEGSRQRPNDVADDILATVAGYEHPTGWCGTVILTMKRQPNGTYRPLTTGLIATLTRWISGGTRTLLT